MPSFLLQPCKLREDRVVRQRGVDPVVMSGQEVIARFLLDMRVPQDQFAFRKLAPASYIGLAKSALNGRPVRFYLRNDDLSGDVSWILKRDPTFASRLLEVWLVERAEWDSRVIEAP